MTDNTCGSCKWWCDNDEDWDHLKRKMKIGRCDIAIMFWDATEWAEGDNGYDRHLLTKYENHKVFVQDGSDYSASLYTRVDHFCGEHQPKETSDEQD